LSEGRAAQQAAFARLRLGLSQAGLAEALDVHRITIAVYEAGRKPIPWLLALADRGARTAGG
jgi:DNA-binding XRE family transcriptional regulator